MLYSCVDRPMTCSGYLFFRKSTWFNSISICKEGYIETQWLIAIGIFLFSKNFIKSSISFSDEPPVEAITGFFVFAILSKRIQSLISALAILIIGRSNFSHKYTD